METVSTDLLELATSGDQDAFRELVEPYRSELQVHCYRILGSIQDAEDALQETLLAAWRGLKGFERRASLRTWLYAVATNRALNMLRAAKRGPEAELLMPPNVSLPEPTRRTEPLWLEPYPDVLLDANLESPLGPEARYEAKEAISLAFVTALQLLPARQRAVLILRDVLGFAPAEIAVALDTSAAAVSSALQRAHRTIDDLLPEQSQQATLRALGDERLREIVETYTDAWERNDVDGILAMLTHDAAFAMPPRATWYRGHEAIGAFLHRAPLAPDRRWRLVLTSAGGQPAFATYLWDEQRWRAHAIDVLTLDPEGLISDVTAFIDAETVRRFGVPDELR
jgi:RNA polymerase sigma-70 factor (TIGR02960 family)